MTRRELAARIAERLAREKPALTQKWQREKNPFRHLVIDRVLPDDAARAIYEAFPEPEAMVLKKDLREKKRIAVQMDRFHPLLSETIYAFQDPGVIDILSEITGIRRLFPDETLYAAGLSLMSQGDFLAPHIDNSHDEARQRYRVLNLLYYVSPEWEGNFGGNLELWDGRVTTPKTVVPAFNRVVLIETHTASWHSVSPVRADRNRCCVSNYYFSDQSPVGREYFQVTSFTGWPGERWRRAILAGDRMLRNGIRFILPKGIVKTEHVFRRR